MSARSGKGDLIVMTPIVQGSEENLIRVERYHHDEKIPDNILHIAGGEHSGILVRRYAPEEAELSPGQPAHLELDFTVFLVAASTGAHKQENRQFRFWFYDEAQSSDRHRLATDFFKTIITSFPKDYVGFLKRVMKLMQTGFVDLRKVELDMRLVEDLVSMPEAKEYAESGSEIESVTLGHVQEVLEHAYPNGLSIEAIATALRCTQEEIYIFLSELQELGVVRELEASEEWIRLEESTESSDDTFGGASVTPVSRPVRADQPTVAIITALFVEKMAVDAMIENKQTVHRYKSDGQSNVYTLGNIGSHRVVATKLSAVGHTRAAMTAAGSITTRLLGNFQQIEHVLVVGVGGGVPHYTDKDRHVRLGDVVLSGPSTGADHAYVYCDKLELDRETAEVQGFKVNKWLQNDMTIPKFAQHLASETKDSNACTNGEANGDSDHTVWSDYATEVEESLNNVTKSCSDYSFSRPPEETDVLMLPLGEGNMVMVPHPNKERNEPRLHLGPIGAGRAVLRDPNLRDEFAERYQIRAFDADFDSVVDAIYGSRLDSWALVRGVADYCDGMRNKQWQAYAALQAAAFVKLLVGRLPSPV